MPFTYRFYLPTDAPQPNPRVSYYSFDQVRAAGGGALGLWGAARGRLSR